RRRSAPDSVAAHACRGGGSIVSPQVEPHCGHTYSYLSPFGNTSRRRLRTGTATRHFGHASSVAFMRSNDGRGPRSLAMLTDALPSCLSGACEDYTRCEEACNARSETMDRCRKTGGHDGASERPCWYARLDPEPRATIPGKRGQRGPHVGFV